MQQQRTRDTAPELAVRRLLHAAGLRYRVDAAPLPELRRRADVVFRPTKVAVFIDGCFWHGCPEHGNPRPASNGWYWPAKIVANRDRDQDTDRRLAHAGWAVIRAWEHEAAPEVAARITDLVAARRATAGPLRAEQVSERVRDEAGRVAEPLVPAPLAACAVRPEDTVPDARRACAAGRFA